MEAAAAAQFDMKKLQGCAAAAATTTSVGDSGFKRICVFCGSSSGNKTVYLEVARELGTELVERDVGLVYGGGSIGLMGKIAGTVHTGGGKVTGVIPRALMGHELCGQTIGELIPVDDMHQRKAEMARLADAFIALPGGYGTLEELMEIITWSQLRIHAKPVGLLNVNGYYDPLLTLFDKAVEEGFLSDAARLILVSAPTPKELIDKMEKFAPVQDKNMPKLAWETVEAPNRSRQPTSTTTQVNFYEVPQRPPRTTVSC
ncbi:unnamed protein product [Sphagnum jensenii]|uniref:Cytokinin riboside 5'-monophosphate phosphoribohydrolase n=1 Tax=Sphagnum jensenii TaxID=128206 RepID=A0ABP1AZZ2_9BRYO